MQVPSAGGSHTALPQGEAIRRAWRRRSDAERVFPIKPDVDRKIVSTLRLRLGEDNVVPLPGQVEAVATGELRVPLQLQRLGEAWKRLEVGLGYVDLSRVVRIDLCSLAIQFAARGHVVRKRILPRRVVQIVLGTWWVHQHVFRPVQLAQEVVVGIVVQGVVEVTVAHPHRQVDHLEALHPRQGSQSS
eukprot:5841095-Prymnesium_polylepis.1